MKSDIYNITYGTAQGSCLGPLLFILFTNDIHLLTTYSRIILFADDTTLIIFNQSIAEGTFPDQMKIAEIIPLYKGKGSDQLINYRHISLLLTMSKLLKKVIYKCTIKFIDKYKLLYKNQYGFHSKRSCEQAIIELIGNKLEAKNDSSASL